jgi:streptomycin 6-kinase
VTAEPDSAPKTPLEKIKAVFSGWFSAAADTGGELEELARAAEHRLANQRQWQRAQADEGVVE